jgi:hypothetical protein
LSVFHELVKCFGCDTDIFNAWHPCTCIGGSNRRSFKMTHLLRSSSLCLDAHAPPHSRCVTVIFYLLRQTFLRIRSFSIRSSHKASVPIFSASIITTSLFPWAITSFYNAKIKLRSFSSTGSLGSSSRANLMQCRAMTLPKESGNLQNCARQYLSFARCKLDGRQI